MMRPREQAHDGYTVVEIVVALGVFGVLAVISATAMISIFKGIRNVASSTQTQIQAENSAEWLSRLIHYTSAPPGVTSPIATAGPASMTFYSWAGAGTSPDAPYKVRVFVLPDGKGGSDVVSDIEPGTLNQGVWQWTGDWTATATPAGASRRYLLHSKSTTPSSLALKYYACKPLVGCSTTSRDVTPTTAGALTLATGEVVYAIDLSLGSTTDARHVVTQKVRLVNAA